MTVLKDRTRSDRHLVSALATAPAGAPNRPRRLSRAPRTHPPGGPAHRGKIAGAGLIAAEALLQLQQSPRIILAHARKHYILGLVASSKYPYPSGTYPTQSGSARVPRVGECADKLHTWPLSIQDKNRMR